jgi:hypothetical protein
MAKKQTRRSISVSRTTYEKLKSFCETNNISMSQFVETRVGDFLGGDVQLTPTTPASPSASSGKAPPPRPDAHSHRDHQPRMAERTERIPAAPVSRPTPVAPTPTAAVPMTSAAARYAVEPPPPIIKPRADQPAPKPAEKRPDQIFTF